MVSITYRRLSVAAFFVAWIQLICCVKESLIEDMYNSIRNRPEYKHFNRFYLKKKSIDFYSENPLPYSLQNTLLQTRQYRFIHDVIDEIAKEENTTASSLIERESFLIPLHKKFTEKDCALGVPKTHCKYEKYRKLDGSCNNLWYPSWGMAGQVMRRYLSPGYHDGIETPIYLDIKGNDLPSPRKVSNVIHREGRSMAMSPSLSVMVMQWGQFLENDIVAIPTYRNKDGTTLDCCGKDRDNKECFSISVPHQDPFFREKCIPVTRSAPGVGPVCYTSKREQMNQATSYIDASHLYGTSVKTLKKIIDPDTGKLKVDGNNLLPKQKTGFENCILEKNFDHCQMTGDGRVNMSPSLSAMYTLFTREHNRIADKLRCLNPKWTPEIIFQETKKIVSALIQQITYIEYLPIILGKENMWRYGLVINSDGHDFSSYSPEVNSGISNVFGTSALKYIHTQIPSKLGFFENETTRYVNLEKTFHRPWFGQKNGGKGFQEIIQWLANDAQPETNRFYVPAVRNSLFKMDKTRLDLAAIDIQRGRDHGLPTYNSFRQFCSLPVAEEFKDLWDHEPDVILKLQKLYKSPMDIDFLTGALSERHSSGSEVGPTLACILGLQFSELKKGDRFWYENPDPKTGFTHKQVNTIRRMSLAKIICNNMNIERIQHKVMFLPSETHHPRIECSEIPDLDLTAWQEDKKSSRSC